VTVSGSLAKTTSVASDEIVTDTNEDLQNGNPKTIEQPSNKAAGIGFMDMELVLLMRE
jgi:hypothetical protein